MRPSRLLLTLSLTIVSITFLLYIIPSRTNAVPPPVAATKRKSTLKALFSFHTPLFPPSAIISLTDDNSTFFLARPAAFGPKLPANGLSGQLWIGSGFGEDNLGSGGRAEGELGCSDVPGWDEGTGKQEHGVRGGMSMKYIVHSSEVGRKSRKHGKRDEAAADENEVMSPKVEDDGTDDHLYRSTTEAESGRDTLSKASGKEHADIQSLQESAEIAGKVVLLSRGGCGFLEKVKWVQRRGGKALIVGDDVRGGPLVTMYAHGDTSNITVPALFTSYTTAHLLSSLIPSGGVFGNLPVDGNIIGLGKVSTTFNNAAKDDDQPNFTTSTEASKPTAKPVAAKKVPKVNKQEELKPKRGWLRRFISWIFGGSQNSGVSRRPPGSGNVDWVMVEEFEEERSKKTQGKKQQVTPEGDGFVIGVHDWRDPDMVPSQDEHENIVMPRKVEKAKGNRADDQHLKGGSITPSSGEYERPDVAASSHQQDHGHDEHKHEAHEEGDGWLHLPWKHDGSDEEASSQGDQQCAGRACTTEPDSKPDAPSKEKPSVPPMHEGLWVTLTPTNISSSPFFDTLLVLVVSPLVTLTVVYALLLLRSRIRRRRWRAPKSVVERLPVRTYHTISSEASTTSIATPTASSPTTPLLQPAPRRTPSRSSSRSRPRSRTTSEVPAQGTSSSMLGEHQESPSAAEKRESGLAEWRRRYGGRQKECVVCLEDYVDGVSRVMSLPCGHEFHAECITPWLTTRRRTCPICKGDVVRMQRGTLSRQNSSEGRTASTRTMSSMDDADEDELQEQAALLRNDSPSAALPIDEQDLERGSAHQQQVEQNSWREWFFGLLPGLQPGGSASASRRRGDDDVDRDR